LTLLVAVGTCRHGFDALVEAADEAARALDLTGFAQIGGSSTIPRHLAWARFLPLETLAEHIAAASLVVCHGGMGLLGEAMRAGKPILAVPRRGRPTRTSPTGDQTALVRRLAERHPIRVCERPEELERHLAAMLAEGLEPRRYALGSDVPALIRGFLQSLPTRSS
jgi:UDP:flavonoid glycosyltransferase YjiC (YdhE family)